MWTRLSLPPHLLGGAARTRQPFDLIYLYPVIPLVRTTRRTDDGYIYICERDRRTPAGPGFFVSSIYYSFRAVLLLSRHRGDFFFFLFPKGYHVRNASVTHATRGVHETSRNVAVAHLYARIKHLYDNGSRTRGCSDGFATD